MITLMLCTRKWRIINQLRQWFSQTPRNKTFFTNGKKAAHVLMSYTQLSQQFFLASSTPVRISRNLYRSLGRTSFISIFSHTRIYTRGCKSKYSLYRSQSEQRQNRIIWSAVIIKCDKDFLIIVKCNMKIKKKHINRNYKKHVEHWSQRIKCSSIRVLGKYSDMAWKFIYLSISIYYLYIIIYISQCASY